MENDDLLVRGRSAYFFHGARFVFAIAAGLFVLQLLVYAIGLTGSPFFVPFGFAAAAAGAIGLMTMAMGWNARCCRACRVGLHPDRYVVVSDRAIAEVRDALRRRDAPAIVAAVTENPHRPKDKMWTSLRLEYCPRCREVARVHLERLKAFFPEDVPPPHVFSGSDVTRLLEISEEDTD